MLAELAGRYRVGRACAVFKRANMRSLHLLDRLGFIAALPGSGPECAVGSDELLMTREIGPRAAARGSSPLPYRSTAIAPGRTPRRAIRSAIAAPACPTGASRPP